jgi:deazaflavin-dependent oxidoreductase (nitroreductase family)
MTVTEPGRRHPGEPDRPLDGAHRARTPARGRPPRRRRRSGRLRRVALYYGRDGERYVLVASNSGARRDPLRYRNLLADPRVVLQVGPELFAASARPATAGERARLWQVMVAVFPYYEGYQAQTTREIPVVVVERESSSASASWKPG